MVPCWNKIISDPNRRRRSTVLKLFYFTRGSVMKWNKIILAEFRPSSVVCQMCLRHCGRSSRAPSVWRLQAAPSDYSRQMLRLVMHWYRGQFHRKYQTFTYAAQNIISVRRGAWENIWKWVFDSLWRKCQQEDVRQFLLLCHKSCHRSPTKCNSLFHFSKIRENSLATVRLMLLTAVPQDCRFTTQPSNQLSETESKQIR